LACPPLLLPRPVEPARVEAGLLAERGDGLSAKTVQNQLNFLREAGGQTPRPRRAALVDVPLPVQRRRSSAVQNTRNADDHAPQRLTS
jgi:hypothetical protein